jgi:uncharacterized membrane protein
MYQETMTAPKPVSRKTTWGTVVLLTLAVLVGAVFVVGFVFPYLSWNEQRFGPYWPKRGWLLLHITGGMVGLLTGPFILWLGMKRRRMTLHRRLGKTYVASMGLSSIAALYMSTHTDFGWVFGMGLAGLAVAWITTTSLALLSIRRRIIPQHQEWMIRSYVVTFGFVSFRIFAGILEVAGIGTVPERLSAASWFCWAVPLLITEAILQGKKIRAVST